MLLELLRELRAREHLWFADELGPSVAALAFDTPKNRSTSRRVSRVRSNGGVDRFARAAAAGPSTRRTTPPVPRLGRLSVWLDVGGSGPARGLLLDARGARGRGGLRRSLRRRRGPGLPEELPLKLIELADGVGDGEELPELRGHRDVPHEPATRPGESALELTMMIAKTKTVAAIVGTGVALTGVALTGALTPWPWVLAHHEALSDLGLVAAGAIAVPLAIWRALVAERQAETARRSLLNARDQKAAEMLGSTLLSVRLGGIYALQTLAAEHPPHYHLGVMRQFCAFVRGPQNAASDSVREDVRAAMDAIAARSEAGIEVEQQEKRFRLDLSGAHLRAWRFSEANLSAADLPEANLSAADLFRANLSAANLFKANLSGANLSWADLPGAQLPEANLSGANLFKAQLPGANLSKANLSKAKLFEANLSEANLSEANLSGADLSKAKLSEEVRLLGADLSGADLSGADLSEANLSGADLSEANLFEADLSGAILSAGTAITQEQLDKTVAVSKKSPIFVGDVRDAQTATTLNWRQRTP